MRITKVTVGVASIPQRVVQLEKTIDSIYNQVDRINVYLNGYTAVPTYLKRKKIVVYHGDNSIGDAGKFRRVYKGYYFSIDDDIIYPEDYVQKCLGYLQAYNYKAVIGFHGVALQNIYSDYEIDEKEGLKFLEREVFHFKEGLDGDAYVHILGTGTTCFHTDTIKFNHKDCKIRNMADVWLGITAQKQGVAMVCVSRPDNYLIPQTTDASIFDESGSEAIDEIKKHIRKINKIDL